jgi:DNA-binding MarR family transcriptional regulator
MCELAKRLHLQGSSTTGLVDRLARYGLVQRRRSQADRRVVHVGLTPKGRRCMETLRRRKQTTLINWFGRLTQSERMHFLATVEKLVAGLASASASVPGAGQKDFS